MNANFTKIYDQEIGRDELPLIRVSRPGRRFYPGYPGRAGALPTETLANFRSSVSEMSSLAQRRADIFEIRKFAASRASAVCYSPPKLLAPRF
jgi:hypothetical protein